MNATLTTDCITFEEWLARAESWRIETQELVRLWYVNRFGSQVELAKRLGVNDRTIRRHVNALRSTGSIPELPADDKRKANPDTMSYSVENSTHKKTVTSKGNKTGESILSALATDRVTEHTGLNESELPPGIGAAPIGFDPVALHVVSLLNQVHELSSCSTPESPAKRWNSVEWKEVLRLASLVHRLAEGGFAYSTRVSGGDDQPWIDIDPI
jgi:hypothetical protein